MFVLVTLIAAILALVRGWVFMLAVGGLHDHYEAIPPIGFGVAVLAVIAVGALVPVSSASVDK